MAEVYHSGGIRSHSYGLTKMYLYMILRGRIGVTTYHQPGARVACTHVIGIEGGEGVHECHAWPLPYNDRPSHPHNAWVRTSVFTDKAGIFVITCQAHWVVDVGGTKG